MKQFSVYCTCFTLMLLLLSGCGQSKKVSPQPPQKQIPNQEQKIDKDSFSHKKIQKMTLEEAEQARRYYEQNQNWYMLTQTLEHMISLATNHAESEPLIYRLAELEENNQNYITAHNLYNNFATLYPGSVNAQKAEYKAIETIYKATLDEFRDQTNTQKVINLGSAFIEKYPEQKDLIRDVRKLVKACHMKLLESELNCLNFYLHKYDYTQFESTLTAIHTRLAYIKNEVIPGLEQSEPELAAIARKIDDKKPEKITPEMLENWKILARELDTFVRNKKRAQESYKHPRFMF